MAQATTAATAMKAESRPTTVTRYNVEDGAAGVKPVKVTLYRWAGKWGPFKVNIPCGECTLTSDILSDTFLTDLAGIPIELEVKDWLTHWPAAMKRGGWHAPVVLVDDKIITQGHALNRGVLTEAVVKSFTASNDVSGNIVFGKQGCPHCVRAKEELDARGIAYSYFDVVKQPRALYEMIARVKPEIGEKTPVTVPQVWMRGRYVGGADKLMENLARGSSEGAAVGGVAHGQSRSLGSANQLGQRKSSDGLAYAD